MKDSTPQPHEFDKRILLVVTGMSPQIVTETLYRLAVTSSEPFIPTEIHIITTEEGAEKAADKLLGAEPGSGKIEQFKIDFNLPDIKFSTQCIHKICDTEGAFIGDSDSHEHNRIASNFITYTVCEFCSDPESAVHVSLAGGRKTMSFYTGYALSLYGRTQDRLSHILVNLPFQNNKDFFYPRPVPEQIEVNNLLYSTTDAKIILSDIPFVRMRSHVPEDLLKGKAGFLETVEKIEMFAQPEHLKFDSQSLIVSFNGFKVSFSPADYAFYYWMCSRRADNEPSLSPDADEFMPDFLTIYGSVTERGGHYRKVEKISRESDVEEQKSWFQSRNSDVQRVIVKALGKRLANPFLIQSVRHGRRAFYHVGLDPEMIDLS